MSPNFLRRPDGESSGIKRTPREAPRASSPPAADTSPHTVGFKRAATVKFDLGRNSIAEYVKENPPNIVEHLPSDSPNIVEHLPGEIDDVTLRNEEILAEWDEHFDGGSRRTGTAARRQRAGMWPGTEPNWTNDTIICFFASSVYEWYASSPIDEIRAGNRESVKWGSYLLTHFINATSVIPGSCE
jgi:hypothetical protein